MKSIKSLEKELLAAEDPSSLHDVGLDLVRKAKQLERKVKRLEEENERYRKRIVSGRAPGLEALVAGEFILFRGQKAKIQRMDSKVVVSLSPTNGLVVWDSVSEFVADGRVAMCEEQSW